MSNKNLFKKAVEINDLNTIKKLFNHPDVNIGKTKNWALTIAAQKNYIELFKLLFSDPNVDLTYKNNSAIKKATRYNSIEIFNLLFNHESVIVDDFIEKLIYDCVSVDCHEILDVLLAYNHSKFDIKLYSNLTARYYLNSLKVVDKYFDYDYSFNNNYLFYKLQKELEEYEVEGEMDEEDEEFIENDTLDEINKLNEEEDTYLKKLYLLEKFYWGKKEVKELLKINSPHIYNHFMKPELKKIINEF